jgi:formylglycine-generating enzyme required for sulfatase activity
MAVTHDETSAMESMDHEQALALLGLSGTPQPDDIEAQYAQRRRKLERRWVLSHSDIEKRVLEAQMRELDAAREAALHEQSKPAGLHAGANVELRAGIVLGDRYAVRAKIGFGPRGAVFRALDLTWGKDVALKALAPQLMLVPGASKRLAETIHQTFGFAHAGIINTYGIIETGAHTLIAMELVEGRALAESCVSTGWAAPKSAAEILNVITQICAALTYAEPKSLHLNLTPQNVFADGGTVRLGDFMMNNAIPVLAGARLTDPAQAAFIAPEVVALARFETPDLKTLDARADQYSVAAIAYYLASGLAPEPGRKTLGSLRPDLPNAFITTIERALALAPEARFESHADFIAAASEVPRRGLKAVSRIAAGLVVVGLIGIGLSITGVLSSRDGRVWEQWLPSGRAAASTKLQAEALQARTMGLRAALSESQRGLQSRGMDARMTLATVEQLAVRAERQDAGFPSLTDARRTAAMLQALTDLVTPSIFTNPEVLNAYNLAGLGDDHIARGRYPEAVAVLTTAESMLSTKLADLRHAEVMIEQQFGSRLPTLGSERQTPATQEDAALLKQQWLLAIEQRRLFAETLDAGLVMIPAGRFVMGDRAGTGARSELPVREVAVAAFKLGRTEVTNREYMACVEAGACSAQATLAPGTQDLPVAGLSWLDAQAYVDWLRIKTGEDYRLPSESEWEYAARAGVSTAYAWGESPGRGVANCLDCGSAWDGTAPAPVGSFAANSFGLHDMTGNVWEWTADCWYRDYTSALPTATAREGGPSCEKRVLRGGSWDNAAWLARVSYRAFAPAITRHELYGFRIAKSVE